MVLEMNVQPLSEAIQREESGSNPSPPFTPSRVIVEEESQKMFLRREGYDSELGELPSRVLDMSVREELVREIAPLL